MTLLSKTLPSTAVLLSSIVLVANAAQPTPKPPGSVVRPTPQHSAATRSEVLRGDLDAIIKRRQLRVLVVPDKLTFFFDGSQLRGAVYEAMREFEMVLNKKLNTGKLPLSFIYIPARRSEVLKMLAEGRGDIAAARLPVTTGGRALVD